jgi:hypothetical protein
MRVLSNNLQVVIGSLHEQVESLQREVHRYSDAFSLLTSKVQELSTAQTRDSLAVLQCTAAVSSQMTALNNNFNYHFQQLQQQQQPPHQEQQQQPIPPPAPPAPPTTPPHNNDNNQRGDDEADEDMEEDLEEEGDLQEEDDGEAGADRVVLPHMEL